MLVFLSSNKKMLVMKSKFMTSTKVNYLTIN